MNANVNWAMQQIVKEMYRMWLEAWQEAHRGQAAATWKRVPQRARLYR